MPLNLIELNFLLQVDKQKFINKQKLTNSKNARSYRENATCLLINAIQQMANKEDK